MTHLESLRAQVTNKKAKYYRSIAGSTVTYLLKNNLKDGNSRIISGNVLSGTKIDENESISFYDYQISAIPEGDKSEFLGWISLV